MTLTYNSLVDLVGKYIDRSDASTVARIPNFISQAEQRISRECKTIGFLVYVTGNFIAGQAVYQKPARWRRNITFNCGTGENNNVRSPIELRVYEYLISYWPDRTQRGTPIFYSDYGFSNYLIAPTPDINYPFEFSYLEMPAPLTVNNQTNWLTNFAPDVLETASILEAMYYLKNDERIPAWESKFNILKASLNEQDDNRMEDRQSNRNSD